MTTIRLFKEDAFAKQADAQITSVDDLNGKTILVFDRTIFFPEGGGQPCDHGKIIDKNGNEYRISETYDKSLDGDVYHVVDAPASCFAIGDSISMELDWQRRFTNMQRHSGEHILSGTFHSLFGAANKGFHMGENYITIDMDLGGRLLTPDEINAAELAANQAIWQNAQVETQVFEDSAHASAMPVRKEIDLPGEITVVTIGDKSTPVDCVACCGTHVATTGEVGLIKIYKVEPNKGMSRVYFDCGSMALARCKHDMQILTEIADRYSTSADEIMHKLDIEEAKIKSAKEQLSALTAYYKEKASAELLAEISDKSDGPLVLTHRTRFIGVDDLLKLGFEVIKQSSNDNLLLAMIQTKDNIVALVSAGDFNCGELVKAQAFSLGGRGGGKQDSARAVFDNAQDLNAFVNELENLI